MLRTRDRTVGRTGRVGQGFRSVCTPSENVNLFHGRRPVAVVLADGILTKEEHKCAFLKGRPLRSVTTSAIASAARSPKKGAMPRAHGYQRLW